MAARHPVTREVTRTDIEWMLDVLAEEIAARGSDGERLLPLYRRIEQEGARMDRDDGNGARQGQAPQRLIPHADSRRRSPSPDMRDFLGPSYECASLTPYTVVPRVRVNTGTVAVSWGYLWGYSIDDRIGLPPKCSILSPQ